MTGKKSLLVSKYHGGNKLFPAQPASCHTLISHKIKFSFSNCNHEDNPPPPLAEHFVDFKIYRGFLSFFFMTFPAFEARNLC
jgi:hypothetical protein